MAAADAISASLMESSATPVDLSDPVALARLSTETVPLPLSFRLLLNFLTATFNLVQRRTDGTINRRLADLMNIKLPANQVPDEHGVSSQDVVIDPHTGLWLRAFLPQAMVSQNGKGVEKRLVIFFFHGGGFAMSSADTFLYDIFCRRLCRSSEAVVLSINYRLAPEHRYPVAYDDCYAALEWLQGFRGDIFQPHELDLSQCVLMGDSAGANIVHHIGCRWAARDEPTSTSLHHQEVIKIRAHVLLCPFFGGEERTQSELRISAPPLSVESADWFWRVFLPHSSNRDHPACNVFGAAAPDISTLHLPPSLVVIAEYDVLKDWQLRYAQGLVSCSKPVRLLYFMGSVHGFPILANGRLLSDLLSAIRSFIYDTKSKPYSICSKHSNL